MNKSVWIIAFLAILTAVNFVMAISINAYSSFTSFFGSDNGYLHVWWDSNDPNTPDKNNGDPRKAPI